MSKTAPKLTKMASLNFVPRFAYGDQAQIAEVSGSGDGTKLGTGLARFRHAAIPWTIQYDEVIHVLEGELTVRTGGEALTAGPRDSIWLPAGTELVYEAADALVFYAIEPADWSSVERNVS